MSKKTTGDVFIVAELSANHNGSLDRACRTIKAAAASGADAIKLQTYTADSLTIDCDSDLFRLDGGTAWDGQTLYELYESAFTPWAWHEKLMRVAEENDMECFSTPFDKAAVEFLEGLHVRRYKIASFELVDVPLLKAVGACKKPVVMSAGMATVEEIQEALDVLVNAGSPEVTLLKCTSSYPSVLEDANLNTIPDMRQRFSCPIGLSDHTLGATVPMAATALGACLIEKHFTLCRGDGGPDAQFSMEPGEFSGMVNSVRDVSASLGTIMYGGTEGEQISRRFRRSLFVVESVRAGEMFTSRNVRSIRPAYGMHPRYHDRIMGRVAATRIERGTPLTPDLIKGWEPDIA